MEKIKYFWTLADGIGLSPLIAIIGFAAYVFLRWGLGMDKLKAIGWVFALNLLGQIRLTKDLLHYWDDVLYFSIGQAVIAFGLYSLAEAIKIMDLADALKTGAINKIRKIFGGQDVPTPPAV